MTTAHATFVAECFWSGIGDDDLRTLNERAAGAAAELAGGGAKVGYLGSILLRADEVVLCLFTGSEAAVRAAAERAGIPFERILEAAATGAIVPRAAASTP